MSYELSDESLGFNSTLVEKMSNEFGIYLNSSSNESAIYQGVLYVKQGRSQTNVTISLNVQFQEEITQDQETSQVQIISQIDDLFLQDRKFNPFNENMENNDDEEVDEEIEVKVRLEIE